MNNKDFYYVTVFLLIGTRLIFKKQGRIHGNPVADGWAGAVMRKPLGIQKYDGPTDRHTDRHGKV